MQTMHLEFRGLFRIFMEKMLNFTVVCGNIALIVIAYAKKQNHTEADLKKSAGEMRKNNVNL